MDYDMEGSVNAREGLLISCGVQDPEQQEDREGRSHHPGGWPPRGSSEPPAPLLTCCLGSPGRAEEVWLQGLSPPLPALPTPGVGPRFLILPLGGWQVNRDRRWGCGVGVISLSLFLE